MTAGRREHAPVRTDTRSHAGLENSVTGSEGLSTRRQTRLTRSGATHRLWLLLHFADLSPSFLTLVFGENIVALRRRT